METVQLRKWGSYEMIAELELIDAPLWWHKRGLSYTASGYGAKIPTSRKVQYKNKLRRVYCSIYGNSGTCWIIVDGEKMIVS